MGLETDLVVYLKADSTLNSLCSGRIYPFATPQGASFPHITYFILTTDRARRMNGRAGLTEVTIQLDVWGLSESTVDAIAARLGVILDGGRGKFNATTRVWNVTFDDEQGLYEPPQTADEVGVYRRMIQARMWITESATSATIT